VSRHPFGHPRPSVRSRAVGTDSLCQIQSAGARGPVLAELCGVALEVAAAAQRSLRTASAAPRRFARRLGLTLRTRAETTQPVRCRQEERNDGGEAATSIAREQATEAIGPRQKQRQGVKRAGRLASHDGRVRKPARRWRASRRKPIPQVLWVKVLSSGSHRWERPIANADYTMQRRTAQVESPRTECSATLQALKTSPR